MAGFFISISFWSRYESLPAFFAFCLLIIIKAIYDKTGSKKIESSLLQFALPFCYSVFFWIFLNWLIMKDAFYFLNSPYSNASFTTVFKSNPMLLDNSYKSIANSLLYVTTRVSYLAPIIFLSLSLPLVLLKKSKKIEQIILFLVLTLPYFAILLFHVDQLYTGESFGWLRFYMYAIAAGSLIALYFATKYKIIAYLSLVLILLGLGTTGYAMNNSNLGREEVSFVVKTMNNSAILDNSRTFADQKKIAELVDKLSGNRVLDTVDKGFAIPLFSNQPKKYVVTSDIDYSKIIKNYPSYVDWIIVPKPTADERAQNKIFTYYPDIWEGKAPSISLYAQIEDWRIYKVNNNKNIASNQVAAKDEKVQSISQCKYIVAGGDSLWRIARKNLGRGKDFDKIIELNKDKEANFDLPTIHPNQELTIPCV